MPRYFLHIREHGTLIVDPEGDELATLEDARQLAAQIIQDILRRPETYGVTEIWRSRSFEITDETGRVVLKMPFADA